MLETHSQSLVQEHESGKNSGLKENRDTDHSLLQCLGKVNLKKQINISECSLILIILRFLVKKKKNFIKQLERISSDLKKKKKKSNSLFI